MAMRKLDRSEWRPFLDRVSKRLSGKVAEVEVASLDIGDQIAAEWLPLLGVVYDPKDDLVEVALEGLDHLIHPPREIYLEDSATGIASLAVVDGEGARQTVKFKDPLM